MEYKLCTDHQQNMAPAMSMEMPSNQHTSFQNNIQCGSGQNSQLCYEPFQNDNMILNIEPLPIVPVAPIVPEYRSCDYDSYSDAPVNMDKSSRTKTCLKRYLAHSFQNSQRRGGCQVKSGWAWLRFSRWQHSNVATHNH